MTPTAMMTAMPGLARPGQKVRWRNPEQARACGWEAIFGHGPYPVVRTVDHSAHRLAAGLVLRTAMGEHEIPEVWLALADEAGGGTGSAVPVAATAGGLALPQGR
jgi:hypothetical protein